MTLTPLPPHPLSRNQCFPARPSAVPGSEVRLGKARGDKPCRKETDENELSPQDGVSGGHPCFLPSKGLEVREAPRCRSREPESLAELRDLTQGEGRGKGQWR